MDDELFQFLKKYGCDNPDMSLKEQKEILNRIISFESTNSDFEEYVYSEKQHPTDEDRKLFVKNLSIYRSNAIKANGYLINVGNQIANEKKRKKEAKIDKIKIKVKSLVFGK